jgi:hypothetical protein
MARDGFASTAMSGRSVYAIYCNASLQPYHAVAGTFGDWSDGSIGSYAIACGEQGSSGRFAVERPDAVDALVDWSVEFREQAAEAPAVTDPVVAAGLASAAADAGTGDTPVDHNTGGADAMRYTMFGAGAASVTIRAYLKSDYDAGNRTVRGVAVTGPDGRWLNPLMLSGGQTYVLVAWIPAVSRAVVSEVTV